MYEARVMEFLQEQSKNSRFGMYDTALEQQLYEERLAALQLQLQTAEARNKELTRRVQLLEQALLATQPEGEQRKVKSGKGSIDWDQDARISVVKSEAKGPKRIWSVEEPKVIPDEPVALSRVQAQPKAAMKSHTDSVRCIEFLRHRSVLVSASEDCTLRLWDVAKTEADVEPYATLRGHIFPILSMTVGFGYPGVSSGQLAFSADISGILRVWEVPLPDEVEPYGPATNFSVVAWKAHYDSTWSLAHHDSENLLLSASSDGTVRLWAVPDLDTCKELCEAGLSHIPRTSFCLSPEAIPAVVSWVDHSSKFVVGYTKNFIAVFDTNTNKQDLLTFDSDQDASIYAVNTAPGLVVSGHEDRRIRFFDLNSSSCIKDLVGHTDSVTALALHHNYLISGSHDGSLRTWDLRTYQCLHELPAHRKKYDEAVLTVSSHLTLPLIASGGADSLIKFYQFS
mmetsp:Transcript_7358/g.13643  ORF Transcript_7358/g.13643 Transcript_7358/m.13643 type:complete len:454 (+) Transcript_7358:1040-2401(+)